MSIRPTHPLAGFLVALALVACSPGISAAEPSAATEQVETLTPTTTASPEPTATPEPSPTPALLDLEIVEWYEHAIPRLVDPTITDKNVDILVHNPNDVPVTVITEDMEFRFINAAGEVVYTGGRGYFSLWEGTWMLPGDSTGFQICVCFQSSGLETQAWVSIELVAAVEPAVDMAYTLNVEAILGEPFDIAEAHLGGSGTAIPITMTNTSDQPLKSIPMRIIARDTSGRYIGMAGFGNSVVSFTQNISIQPGESLYGSNVSEIDYFDEPLTYEVVAIGIIAVAAPTPGAPEGTPAADWQGIPIMPGATHGGEADDGYRFSTQAASEEIVQFYEAALTGLGYSLITSGEQSGITYFLYQKGSSQAIVAITTVGASNLVQLSVTP